MNYSVLVRFVLLGSIWGGSFLFMRIVAPVIGGFWTADLRLFIGALTLLALMKIQNLSISMRYWKHYLATGLLNCALPFVLFGIASQVLPAGYAAVFNSTTPLWVALFGISLLKEPLTIQRGLALLLGVIGVMVIAQPSGGEWSSMFLGSLVACIFAPIFYALSAIYTKVRASEVSPQAMATMSQLFGAIMLLPFALTLGPSSAQLTQTVIISVVLLGVVCSGFAFWLFYSLINDIGPLLASAVTFLIPLFGIFWGWLILHERLGWYVFLGGALIISGAVLLYRSNTRLATNVPSRYKL